MLETVVFPVMHTGFEKASAWQAAEFILSLCEEINNGFLEKRQKNRQESADLLPNYPTMMV